MGRNGSQDAGRSWRDDDTGLLIDRLALAIVDDSLPLKEVERELRGSVAEVAIHKRGLDKRETASRCGVTEKSIENYLREARANPKSPEREIARVLQDEMLTLEEIYERVHPVLGPVRPFTLDDAKRSLEKLIRTGEVKEYPGRRYRAVDRPSIRYPATVEAHRQLVSQKAKDLDYVVLTQKEATQEDIQRRDHRYARVVRDTNLVRIDFTVGVPEEDLPRFYEELTAEIAKLTMKYEKKKGPTRVRVLLAMRSVTALLVGALFFLLGALPVAGQNASSAVSSGLSGSGRTGRSWELDRQAAVERPESAENNNSLGIHRDAEEGGGAAQTAADRTQEEPEVRSRRGGGAPVLVGDANLDGVVDIADAVILSHHLYGGASPPPCPAAGDVDGDGKLTPQDVLALLRRLFSGDDHRTSAGGGPRVFTARGETCPSLPAEDAAEEGAGEAASE